MAVETYDLVYSTVTIIKRDSRQAKQKRIAYQYLSPFNRSTLECFQFLPEDCVAHTVR